MSRWQYTKGLHDLGRGCFAYLQPDGSWGWSNAGLVTDGEQTLLVDTLFDLPQMLKTTDIEHGQADGEGESRDHLDQWAQAAAPKDRGQKKRNVIIAEKDMLDTGARVLAALRRLPDEDRARDPGWSWDPVR